MIPGLPVSAIPQGKYNHHHNAYQQLLQAVGYFKDSFIEAHHASKMI
jgi:hypothetical protein